MKKSTLARIVQHARCRVFGWEDASNDPHREVLAALIRGTARADAVVLCEPSLARNTTRPPDVVLVCPRAGLHVLEVKGITLAQIAAIEPGGQFAIQYDSGARSRNPFAQVRNAMFDIRDAAQRVCQQEFAVPTWYWVILPLISYADWMDRWGEQGLCPPQLLFQEDLEGIGDRLLLEGQERLKGASRDCWDAGQMQVLMRAFGDSSALYPAPEERAPRRVREATLGEMFDEAAEVFKALSDEQQRIASQKWETGPRLVRGVAGSGKTVVLANHLARRIASQQKVQEELFEETAKPRRLLAVCFNRSLVPLLRKKIELAYTQRTGQKLPPDSVDVLHYNTLAYDLSQRDVWRYQKVNVPEEERARKYLSDLRHVREHQPWLYEANAYSGIYVDEGQDFIEADFELLAELCRASGGEPGLYVFYDDAQNLFGRPRPNWQRLGLNVVGGRSHVMTECFRNTRQILEPAFNVLYGSYAKNKAKVPTKAYGDLATLEDKQLLEEQDGRWIVQFARREGRPPQFRLLGSEPEETAFVISRLTWLLQEQEVRPQDILVLTYLRNRVKSLADAITNAKLPGFQGVHVTIDKQDELLCQRGHLTVSTVASAKGYDACCVLLPGVNAFPDDVSGRAMFYVGCTRALEYLEVSAASPAGLVPEIQQAFR